MRLIKSFAFAWNGLKACFKSEPNFRIHVLLGILVVIFAILFNVSLVEWELLCLCIAIVLTAELLNTALEKLCDVVHKEQHPGIKKVKDISAGAVLVASAGCLITGLIIFLPKIFIYLKALLN